MPSSRNNEANWGKLLRSFINQRLENRSCAILTHHCVFMGKTLSRNCLSAKSSFLLFQPCFLPSLGSISCCFQRAGKRTNTPFHSLPVSWRGCSRLKNVIPFVSVLCWCCLRVAISMQSSVAVSLFEENTWNLSFIAPLGQCAVNWRQTLRIVLSVCTVTLESSEKSTKCISASCQSFRSECK